jgi:hypothetical protein
MLLKLNHKTALRLFRLILRSAHALRARVSKKEAATYRASRFETRRSAAKFTQAAQACLRCDAPQREGKGEGASDQIRYRKRVGQFRVRHMCEAGVLSKPKPSFGCLKLRPMMSVNSSRSTTASGSKE